MMKNILSILVFACASTFLQADFYQDEFSSCEDCGSWWMPDFSADFTLAVDTFRSLPDGSFQDNTGAYVAVNSGIDFQNFFDYCLEMQLGASYGVYDWNGRQSPVSGNLKESQQQTFLTGGFSLTTPYCCGFNFGVVYDWMINKNFSVFALHADLSQVRYKTGYLINGCDEIGIWGTNYAHTSRHRYHGIPVKFRAISQLNLFWQHNFDCCAQTSIWVGFPYRKGLMHSPGRDGRFILGASFYAPLTSCLSVTGHASYMAPRSAKGGKESRNYASNVCFGIVYSFGTEQCQKPYLPLADNSNFIADTNINF